MEERARHSRNRHKNRTWEEIEVPAEKRCSGCDEVKPSSEFHRKKAEKDGLYCRCKACNRMTAVARYKADPEKAKAAVVAWQKANPEAYREKQRQIHRKHAERYNAQNSANYHAKKEAIGAQRRERWAADPDYRQARLDAEAASYQANPTRKLTYAKQFRQTNKDAIRAGRNARRAREVNAGGSFTASDWQLLMEQHNHRCAYCLRCEASVGPLNADHMLPLARGGTNDAVNIAPACKSCNSVKRTRTPLEFLAGLSAPLTRRRNP